MFTFVQQKTMLMPNIYVLLTHIQIHHRSKRQNGFFMVTTDELRFNVFGLNNFSSGFCIDIGLLFSGGSPF